jgi:hypothetical protein
LNGIPPVHLEKPNIDLLFLGRRLWKNFWENCRLQTLEQEILGILRNAEEELPSSEIPQRYFDFLETGDAFYMSKVFQHNRQDILSLPALLQHISACFGENDFKADRAGSALGRSRLFLEQGRMEEARICLQNGQAGAEGEKCRHQLALLYKRQGDHEAARELWQQETHKSTQVLEELAKYYEHKVKDLEQALNWTETALDQLLQETKIDGRAMAAWQQRRHRIKSKQQRHEQRKAETER